MVDYVIAVYMFMAICTLWAEYLLAKNIDWQDFVIYILLAMIWPFLITTSIIATILNKRV